MDHKLVMLDKDTDITESYSTTGSLLGDTIDIGAATHRAGEGQVLYVVFQIYTTPSHTCGFDLVGGTAVASGGDINAGARVLIEMFPNNNPVSEYVKGLRFGAALPFRSDDEFDRRYLQVRGKRSSAATLTAGAAYCFLTLNPGVYRAFPNYEGT